MSGRPSFEIIDDPARACAALMIGAASAGGDIVLAGGSTPRAAYRHFVEAVEGVGLDLSEATFWLGDERCVEPTDENSNYRMIKQSLLDALAQPPTCHRMRGELGPDQGAADYSALLHAGGTTTPAFDLMLLGIGPVGHTLSLFPDQDSLQERSRLVVGVPDAGLEPFVPRISMTLAAVALARRVVVLASGEGKADAIAEAYGPDAEPTPSVPSSMIASHARQLTVLLDPAAASGLPRRGGS